jgi:16S rRNA processing protein RimM
LTEQFVVGLVGAPFGLKGFVKVQSLSGEKDHILRLGSVTLRRGENLRLYEIEDGAEQNTGVILKFRGIDSPEAAKTLGGAELVTRREEAAPLSPDEYYVEDLRGIEVVAADSVGPADPMDPADRGPGEVLGHITNVVEGGGGDLIEMRLPDGTLRFVPFRREFFGEVSPEKGRAVLLTRWVLE